VGCWSSLEGTPGEGGALGGTKSLALHFGEISEVNGRAEGGVWGGVVLMQLTLAQLVAHTGIWSPLGGRGPTRSAMTWRRRCHSDPAMPIDIPNLPP
jgi:hypothetical protein